MAQVYSNPNEREPEEILTNSKSVKDIIINDLGVGSIVYSPIFGEIKFVEYNNQLQFITIETGQSVVFCDDGRFNKSGDILLFPSKENQDWTSVPIKYPATIQELENYIINYVSKETNKRYFTFEKLRDIKKSNLIKYLQVLARYLDYFTDDIVKSKRKEYPYEVCPKHTRLPFEVRRDLNKSVTELYEERRKKSLSWELIRLKKDYSIFAFRYRKSAEEFMRLTKDFLPIICINPDTGIFYFPTRY